MLFYKTVNLTKIQHIKNVSALVLPMSESGFSVVISAVRRAPTLVKRKQEAPTNEKQWEVQ